MAVVPSGAPRMQFELAQVLNALAVGVCVVDATAELVFVNQVALKILGASRLEELQRSAPRPFEFPNVRGEDGSLIPLSSLPFKRALSGESVVELLEFFDRDTGGSVIVRSRTTPIRGPDGAITGAVKLAVDITNEYRLAKIRDEFIRQAAHALKTPLASIKANAELMSASTDGGSNRLDALVRGVDRVDGLVQSFLDLADQEGGIFSFSRLPVPLQRVIDGAVERLPESVARRVKVSSTPVVVQCDETRLRRAVHALVNNALRFSPGSSIVEVSVTATDGTARIAVTDHGYGIAREKQPHIFEKYYRAHVGTEQDPGGLGVGLFVARQIFRQHNGNVWFDSTERIGSTFYAELPASTGGTS
jgi:PAS domain S-box-containing protein